MNKTVPINGSINVEWIIYDKVITATLLKQKGWQSHSTGPRTQVMCCTLNFSHPHCITKSSLLRALICRYCTQSFSTRNQYTFKRDPRQSFGRMMLAILLEVHPADILTQGHRDLGIRLFIKSIKTGTSLVAQWLRIRLPMQGTRVRALVWEDLTCRGATKPVHHNYWAWSLEPTSHNYWAHVPQLLKPARLEPMLHKRSHRKEKPAHRNEE